MAKDEKVTAGKLAFEDDYHRKQRSPDEKSVGVGELAEHLDEPGGSSLEEMLPRARHPDLRPAEIEPPMFLRPLEQMKDIYMRIKSRMSRRTQRRSSRSRASSPRPSACGSSRKRGRS